jgi:CheY-like chemotaxis protein
MPPTLLVVDDDPVMRSLEARLLSQEGYAVEIAEDGPEALEKLTTTRYAGIVLDLGLPGMDGYEVARQTRQLGLNKETPIVLVTVASSARPCDEDSRPAPCFF